VTILRDSLFKVVQLLRVKACECTVNSQRKQLIIIIQHYVADSFSVQLVAFLHPRVQIIVHLLPNVTSWSQSISVENETILFGCCANKAGGGGGIGRVCGDLFKGESGDLVY
jgi:hypothetical protein